MAALVEARDPLRAIPGGGRSDALAAHGLADTPLIAEVAGRGGAVQFMARALDLRWRTLVF